MKHFRNIILFTLIIISDRITKFFALKYLVSSSKEIVVTPFLNLILEFNRGISWSMLSFPSNNLFFLLTTFICFVIVVFSIQTYHQHKKNMSIFFELFVIGGALSNIIDRFVYGAVIDFIELHIGTWYWPIFNIADMCIVVGIICIIIKNVVKTNVYKN